MTNSTTSTNPRIEDIEVFTENVRDALGLILNDISDVEKAKRGRRFSTYHEAHAFLADEFQELHESMQMYARGLDTLWAMVEDDTPIESDGSLDIRC